MLKYFGPGDKVKVIAGAYEGHFGMVISTNEEDPTNPKIKLTNLDKDVVIPSN